MLSFLLFYGLMVGKYALICAMEIQKIHMVVHIFSGFALFTENECIAELNPFNCKLLTANKVPFDLSTNGCKSNCPSSLRSKRFQSSYCTKVRAGAKKKLFSNELAQKRLLRRLLSILKLVSFESLAGNDFSERGTQAEAQCERNLNRQL